MGRDSFIVHRSYFDAVDILPDEEQLELYKSIMRYGFDGHYPEDISTHARAMLMLITPNIDASNKRYDAKKENGSKGGRPKKTEEWHDEADGVNKETEAKPRNNRNKPNGNLKKPSRTEAKPNIKLDKDVDVDVDKDVDRDREYMAPTRDNDQDKKVYGRFKRVRLTDGELSELKQDYPNWEARINRLDSYLEQHQDKHYANHFATILSWADEDAKKNKHDAETDRDLSIYDEMDAEDAEWFRKIGEEINE